MKVYDKRNLKDKQSSKALHREIFILAILDHKNIVKLNEVIDSRSNVHLIMELCQGKSLYCLMKNSENGLPEQRVRNIFGQIVSGVAHIHSKNMVHRDLKLENILITPNDQVKIIDFGFATQ